MFSADSILSAQEVAWLAIQRIVTYVGDGDITATREKRYDQQGRIFGYDALLMAIMKIAADGLGISIPDYPVAPNIRPHNI